MKIDNNVIATDICPQCEKIVYEAEGTISGNRRYHKKCFKCSTCKHKLDCMSALTLGGNLFCRTCHNKQSLHKSPKIYTDTAAIKPTDDDTKGCPRCGGIVFEAEKLIMKDDVYHKRCFTCLRCCRSIDSLTATVGPNNEIYCSICLKIVTVPEAPLIVSDTTLIQAGEDEPGCPRCGGKVFDAEKMTAKGGLYHKRCFNCIECNRVLDYQTCCDGPDEDIYCKLCYAYKHGHKAPIITTSSDVASIQGQEGDADVCPRCNGLVFTAEKQVTKNASYHQVCFTCILCKHQLDAGNFINGPDLQIYCVHCYKTTHGHKALTKSIPLDTTSIKGEIGDRSRCPRCAGKVFAAEKMIASSGWYHTHCFRCAFCNQPLDSTSVCDGPDNKIYCRVCYGRMVSCLKPKYFDDAAVDTSSIQAAEGESSCPRCNGKVFEAEKIASIRNIYHKKCFTCRDCARPMDQFIACDAPDGEVVCNGCYAKKYSCSIMTMSGGDMLKFLNTSLIMGEQGEQNVCPRCTGKVFHAERVVAAKNIVYHRRCATCRSCERPLTSKDICQGNDEDIYCQACYARKFGAPGYRGAGNGCWTDTESAGTLRPIQNSDVTKIKGTKGQQDTCPRCDGKIFETERKASTRANWHKKCFCCKVCQINLSGDLSETFDGPGEDGEIYCRNCFKKIFGNKQAPLIYSDTTTIKPEMEEEGCPRCHGAVFKAEEVIIKDRSYHKKCLTCKNCLRLLDITIMSVGPDGEIFCTVCCARLSRPGRYEIVTDTTVIQGEESTQCLRCKGKVFEAEKMTSKHGLYHKSCFFCLKCKCHLDNFNVIEGPEDEVYCRVCYKKYFGPGGKNKFGEKHLFATADEDPDACGRCKGKVFEAEKIHTKSGLFHLYCLNCNDCRANLDASSFYNGPDSEVYCRQCYAVTFGHKSKSDYNGWLDVKAIQSEKGSKDACPRCNGKVFEAERMITHVGNFHRPCFSCLPCGRKLDSTTCCEGPDMEIYCNSCYSYAFGAKRRNGPRPKQFQKSNMILSGLKQNDQDDLLARSTVETWVIKAEKGDQNWCPRCEGKVFEAEKMVTAKGAWFHRNCFRCLECLRLLDSLSACDGKDGAIYCKGCYGIKFGPQTRSTEKDLKMMDTTLLKSNDPNKNCPRCGGEVFKAEAVVTKKFNYHKKCSTCIKCEKKLESSTINVESESGEIYCRSCYSRTFGTAGYRGNQCSDWLDAAASSALRHSFQAF